MQRQTLKTLRVLAIGSALFVPGCSGPQNTSTLAASIQTPPFDLDAGLDKLSALHPGTNSTEFDYEAALSTKDLNYGTGIAAKYPTVGAMAKALGFNRLSDIRTFVKAVHAQQLRLASGAFDLSEVGRVVEQGGDGMQNTTVCNTDTTDPCTFINTQQSFLKYYSTTNDAAGQPYVSATAYNQANNVLLGDYSVYRCTTQQGAASSCTTYHSAASPLPGDQGSGVHVAPAPAAPSTP